MRTSRRPCPTFAVRAADTSALSPSILAHLSDYGLAVVSARRQTPDDPPVADLVDLADYPAGYELVTPTDSGPTVPPNAGGSAPVETTALAAFFAEPDGEKPAPRAELPKPADVQGTRPPIGWSKGTELE